MKLKKTYPVQCRVIFMKRLIFILAMLWSVAQAQTIGYLRYDTVKMAKNGGTTELVLENATKAVTGGVLTNTGNGRTAFVAPAGASVPISSLTAATATNSINNVNYGQTWSWNSLNGVGLTLISSSSSMTGLGNQLFRSFINGSHSASNVTSYAIVGSNIATGTNSTSIGGLFSATGGATLNVGGEFSATGATTNYAGRFINGKTSFGTVGASSGVLEINGSTSGTITVQPVAAAGTWTLTLPTNDGDADQFLQTNGSGVSSWATAATATNTLTLTNKRWTARVGSTTSSGTPTINTDNVDIYKLTALAANITSMTTNLSGTPVDGDILEIQITDDGTPRTIAWGASFVSSSVVLPTTTTTSTTLTTILQYYTTSSYGNNKWVCVNYY